MSHSSPQVFQPGHAAQPSMQMPTGVERRGGALAIVAAAFAALWLVLGPVQALVFGLLIAQGVTPSLIGLVSTVSLLSGGVLAVGALGFGLAAVLRRERLRVLAAAALGIGVSGLVGLLSGGVQMLASSGF